jgi:exosortase A-associated hydrolase 2
MTRLNRAEPLPETVRQIPGGKAVETSAGFVGDAHPAFFLQFRPTSAPRAHLLYLPPFAEEMNRCRSVVAEQARWFARHGLSCTLLDYFGSGESSGDLNQASLPIWRQNIDDLCQQLLQHNQVPLYLWGCRLGALMAMDYLSRTPGAVDKLLLWQPVLSGSLFVTQILRQRMASRMQKGDKAESCVDMRGVLAAGRSLDVAGYRIGGDLVSAIDRLEVESMLQADRPEHQLDIFWLEHRSESAPFPGTRTRRAITRLEQAGARIDLRGFTSDPVWQLHKRGVSDDLLAQTRSLAL